MSVVWGYPVSRYVPLTAKPAGDLYTRAAEQLESEPSGLDATLGRADSESFGAGRTALTAVGGRARARAACLTALTGLDEAAITGVCAEREDRCRMRAPITEMILKRQRAHGGRCR